MVTRPAYVPAPVADDLAAQDAALDNPNPCPVCRAQRDSYCVNPLTGRYLHNRVSHWQRIPRPPQATDQPKGHGNRGGNLDQDGDWT